MDDILDVFREVGQNLVGDLSQLQVHVLKGCPHLIPVAVKLGDLTPALHHQPSQDTAQGAHHQKNHHQGQDSPGNFPPGVDKPEDGLRGCGESQGK